MGVWGRERWLYWIERCGCMGERKVAVLDREMWVYGGEKGGCIG